MYDIAILGGGPAGYVAAGKAGTAGLSVLLIEQNELGGVCLNEGCIPTKTLLYSAKVLDTARHADRYGVTVGESAIDFGAIFKRKTKVVKKLVGGVKVQMRNAGVEVVSGQGVITGRSAAGFTLCCGDTDYEARNVLVCTGSEAVVPPIPGLREGLGGAVVTNREILQLTEQPASLVVIGGGVIGMEFASFFNSIGTQVTVIEMLPKILGPMDAELSALLQAQYEKKGVTFHLSCKVVAVEGNEVVYQTPEGETCRVQGDKILVSVGRRARLQGIGLENIGVEFALNPAGRPYGVKVDDRMRTSVPGVAVNTILGIADQMHYNAVPGVVYTNPEVAGVGALEGARTVSLPMAFSGRFVAENERGEGLCKVVLDSDDCVIGVHMLGNPASELIHGAAIAIEQHMRVEQLERVIFPHPTVSEILKETVARA